MRAVCNQSHRGFTIVELLIVIVVIAILVAISIVAYNGVSNSANDSAVKNDLANFAKAVHMYKAEAGHFPVAGSMAHAAGGFGNSTISNIKFRPTKSAYETSLDNLFYCSGTFSGEPSFIITARSKSRERLIYTPENGIQPLGATDIYVACLTGAGWDGTHAVNYGCSYGYRGPVGTWYSWTD